MAQDFGHDADQRLGGIDYDATAGYVFFCGVSMEDEFSFALALAPVIIRTAVEPCIECLRVNV